MRFSERISSSSAAFVLSDSDDEFRSFESEGTLNKGDSRIPAF